MAPVGAKGIEDARVVRRGPQHRVVPPSCEVHGDGGSHRAGPEHGDARHRRRIADAAARPVRPPRDRTARPGRMADMRPRHVLLLAIGVVATSFAAIFIRYADAPTLSIAFYRNAIAAAVALGLAFARRRGELLGLSRRQFGIAVLSGVLLALHFGLWIPSVKLTTIAASVVLVTTSPIFVAAGARVVFGDRIGRATLAGILVGL